MIFLKPKTLIKKSWYFLSNPALLKVRLKERLNRQLQKVSFKLNKTKAFGISCVKSISYREGDKISVPVRIDHLPRQLQKQFYQKYEVLYPESMADDREGIHPPQIPNACFKHMPQNKNGLYQRIWTKKLIDELKNLANRREDFSCEGYPGSVFQHYAALDKIQVASKKAMVIGSASPWLECILLSYKAKEVLTIECGNIPCDSEEIKIIDRLLSDIPNKESFDIIYSYSSIEHNGLGRYGDPINPNGDQKTMDEIYDTLVAGGIAIIGIPVCIKNVLIGNGHRAYSEEHLNKHLFKKFKILDYIGYPFDSKTVNYTTNKLDWQNQPLFILQKQ